MKIVSYLYDVSKPLIPNTRIGNLGDAIQTLGVLEFFKQNKINHSGFIDRSNLIDGMFINGWHRYPHELLPINAVFCSIHTDKNHLSRVNKNCVIGCRDSYTYDIANSMGFRCFLTGCITINFPISTISKNNNILYIDSIYKEKNQYTQFINESLSWENQLDLANKRINLISSACLVHTTRLHILIPCIAMGIPVVLDRLPIDKERFSFIKNFIPIGKPIEYETGIREELINVWKKNTTYLDIF